MKNIIKLVLVHILALFYGLNGYSQNPNYAEALQKSLFFYECQRSGNIESWSVPNRVSWRGNSGMTDGSDVGKDLTGGLYDAGDNVKFNYPMAFTATSLAWGAIEFGAGYTQSGQMDELKNNIRFINEYLLKCHTAPNELYAQVGDGNLDHGWWGAAEVMQMARPSQKITAAKPGSDLAAETAAAMASASILFKNDDPAFSATLLNHAKQLYLFAETYKGKYSESLPDVVAFYNSWSGYQDELVWGALWLYLATNDQTYLTKAVNGYNLMNKETGSTTILSYKWGISWDDKSYGNYVLMSKILDDAAYHADAQRHLDYWVNGIAKTAAGFPFLSEWGSCRYAANTSFLMMVYSKYSNDPTKTTTYSNYAKFVLDYILGKNPRNMSYMVGYGANFPKRVHHRTAHGTWMNYLGGEPADNRHTIYGAIAGGLATANDMSYVDDRGNYYTNEVACDYNALATGALAGLTQLYGGTPLAAIPAEVSDGNEYYIDARINVQEAKRSGFSVWCRNHSAWPAKVLKNMAFRYYVNISEGVAAGLTANNYTTAINYAEGGKATISKLLPCDEANNIYYVEVKFVNDPVYPGGDSPSRREAQFSIATTGPWDPTNDPSYANLISSALKRTDKLTMYNDGVLLSGIEPCGIINHKPVASLATNVTTGNIPFSVSFNASGSTDADGDALTYAWNFGDGTTATGVTTTHNYTTAGLFTATLNVSDSKLTDTKAVVITAIDNSPKPPVAAFTATPQTGYAPLSVAFNASTSTDPNNDIASYTWNFGDGTSATGITASHIFTTAGTFLVNLTVRDSANNINVATKSITVNDKPVGVYAYGVIPAAATTADALSAWQTWKSLFIEPCSGGKYRVKWGLATNGWEKPGETVSEGIGYGMLLAAYAGDKAVFDGLWAYYKSFPDPNGLMHWHTSGCTTTLEQNAATDAELDVTMALIVAYYQFGNGTINYEADAKSLISKIKQFEVEASTYTLKPGDMFGGSDLTNISYFAPGYMRAFGEFTNDVAYWNNVVTKCYSIINKNLTANNAKGGLVSDWCNANGQQASGKSLAYYYDACRTPWRIATDYLWYGSADSKAYLDKTIGFVETNVGGIELVKDGYNQDGSLYPGTRYHNATFVSLFGVSGVAGTQALIDEYYAEIMAIAPVSYFDYSFNTFARYMLGSMFYNPLTKDPKPTFDIVATAGTGGTIAPAGIVKVSEGASQSFAITPGIGYAIDYLVVDNGNVTAQPTYTFTNVTTTHTIAAVFKEVPIQKYTITATASVGGTITPNGSVLVNQGSSQSFAITPSAGYVIDYVTVDGVSSGNISTYEFKTVSANHTIAATFKEYQIPTGANFLTAQGNQLIDAAGNVVRLTGVNWFGFETSQLVPHGLWSRDCKSMLKQIKDLGFNCVRIPWCNKILDPAATIAINAYGTDSYTGVTPMNAIESTFTKPIQLLDKVVEYCQELNLKIILDNHSKNPDGYLAEALWYTDNVSDAKWISDWVFLANRYKDSDAVIAMDLKNEPHGKSGLYSSWGNSNPATDWNKAAERCGNAVLQVNPNVLIMVEGVELYQNETYWWGGNLKGVKDYPVQLSNNNKLVYSPHEYGPTVFNQTWFSDPTFPSNMNAIWADKFDFIYQQNIAPLLCGEFGIKQTGGVDEVWFDYFLQYMGSRYSWTFWCWNPNSGDTGGLLDDQWKNLVTWKYNKLAPYLAPEIPNGTGGTTVAVTGVQISKTTLTLDVNTTSGLTATVLPSNASYKQVIWKTSNATVATVANGTVSALAAGTATITVETVDGGFSKTCAVTVNQGSVLTTITVTPATPTITVGQTQQFTAVGKDQNGTVMPFTPVWSVNNAGTISTSGLFTGTTAGTFTVKAQSGTVSGLATITVTEIQVPQIPGKIEAEAYNAMQGIQKQATTDTGGGQNIGYVEAGDWLDYNVNVSTAGKYNVSFRVASQVATGAFQLKVGSTVLATVKVPNTGGWQTWQTVIVPVTLVQGIQTLRILATGAGLNINWFEFKPDVQVLTTITVTPAPASIFVGATQQFTAVGKDQNGAVMAFTPVWSVDNSGTISSTGLFSGTTRGNFIVKAQSGTVSGNAAIEVKEVSVLTTITVTPASGSINKGQTQQFTAVGKDQNGVVMAFTPVWSVDNSGTINTSGLFSGTTVGIYTVKAESGTVFGTATIEVKEASVLTTITVSPANASIYVAQNQQFTAVGKDQFGAVMAFNPIWSADNGGIISTSGIFTGTINSIFTVKAESGTVFGTATIIVNSIPAFPIPGKIEAEAYNAMQGIQVQPTTDAGGGQNIGYVEAGDWLDYNVNVSTAGKYNVSFRVASQVATGAFQLKAGATILATVKVPNTGGWQTWQTVTVPVTLTQGTQTLRIAATGAGLNINWMDFVVAPFSIKIEAESYTTMFGIQTQATTDAGGGLNVGYSEPGDWMNYSVTVPTAGIYTVNFRIASLVATGKIELRNSTGTVLATLAQGSTGGWQTWVTKSVTATLPAGAQTLRIYYTGAGLNINWFELVAGGTKSVEDFNSGSDIAESKELQLYPNPVSDELFILNADQNSTVEVYNLSGKLVLTRKLETDNNLLNVSTLKAGLYILKANGNQRTSLVKFIKK
jgi:PKD repeat protein